MFKNIFPKIVLSIGVFFLILSLGSYLLMTSDIPVKYSITEAVYLHIFLFISTLAFILFSLLIQHKRTRYILIAWISLYFIMSLSHFKIKSDVSMYFTTSYAQIVLAFVLHPLLILIINFFLLKNQKITSS